MPPAWTRRRRGLLAVVASLAVHAAVGGWLWRRHTEPLRHPEAPVEITIESRPALPSPPPAERAPPAAPPERTPLASAPPARHRPARTSASRSPSSPAPPSSSSPAPPSSNLLRMRSGVPLTLDWGTFQAVEGASGPPAPGAAPTRRRERGGDGRSTAERVAEMLAPTGEDNVQAGRVHPQFYDYLRDVQKRFQPTLATVEKDGGPPKVAGFLKGWWQQYVRDLAAWNGHSAHAAPTEEQMGGVELSCDVCLTVRLGETPRIDLVRRSISGEMDALALEAVRNAVQARPATEPLIPAGGTGTSA